MNINYPYQLSVVIPVYNGASSIRRLVETLYNDLSKISFEVILVNDGSPDNSEEICFQLSQRYENLKFISLRKNFGEFNAVICGLNHVSGKYAVMIDDDFQNPPAEILKLYEKAESENRDVIYSYYSEKKHHWFRNLGSWLVNEINVHLLRKPRDLYLSSFKLIRKEVVEEIIKYTAPYPYIDALIFRVTNNIGKVQVTHSAREEGKSNYTFKKLHSLLMTIIFGYSILPVRLILYSGIFAFMLSILLILLYFLNVISNQLIPIVALLSGTQLIGLGIIGEYVSKNFLTLTAHPQFSIKYKASKNA